MGQVKNDIRNRMKEDLLEASLAIKLNGKPVSEIPNDSMFYEEAMNYWEAMKTYRIHNK